ncbi:MAG: hypothetical protein OHK0046_22980 [Anaerolineae bacterium]
MQKSRRNILIGLLVVLVIIIGVVLLALRQIRSIRTPLGAPSGEIAFISNRDGTWDLFALDPEGNLTNLTPEGDFYDYFASYAFDGEMINFLSNRGSADEIGPAQVPAEGGEVRALSIITGALEVFRTGRLDWDPVWFADGERIVWSSLRDLNLEIYVGAETGEDAVRLTNNGANDWFPSLSPDGTEIVFISDRNDGQQDVYKIDINGENLTRLTDSNFDDIHPAWSQDGEQLLYVHDIEDAFLEGEITFYIMAADGSNKRPFGENEIFTGDMSYSADGSQVVYMSNEDGHWHIYMMDADGRNVTRLTDGNADHLFPVWRPVPASADETEAESDS